MTDETLERRYSNEEFFMFLKAGETLYCARDALSELCRRVMDEFQHDMLRKCKIDPNIEYLKHTCKSKDIKRNSLPYACLDGICNKMLTEVVNGSKSVFWGNTDLRKWPTDSWEIAKVFMGQGQKPENKGPDQTDSSGIFHLILHCNRFEKYNISEDTQKLIKKRNDIAHAAIPGCSGEDLDDNIKILITFFENLSRHEELKQKERSAMKDAIHHMKLLTQADFTKYLCVKYKEEQICSHTLDELVHMFGQLPLQETMPNNEEFKAQLENFVKTLLQVVSSSRTRIRSQDYAYDIHMIYCDNHAHDAKKLQEILEKFIKVRNDTVKICMDVEDEGDLGQSKLDLLAKAVKSRCNFVLCNKDQSDGEWTAFRAEIGLLAFAVGQAAWTVPLRLRNSSCLDTNLLMRPEINISPLLDIDDPGRTDLADMNQKQIDVLKIIEQFLKSSC